MNPFSEKNHFTTVFNGTTVYASISPCCFMHKGYGLQVKVSLLEKGCNAESVFLNDKANVDDLTVDAALKLTTAYLEAKGLYPLQKAIFDWKNAQIEFDRDEEKRSAAEAISRKAREDSFRQQGYTHKTVAVIHPKQGGDDYFAEMFSIGAPSAADLRRLLRPSAVKTDYKVSPL